MNSSLTDHDLGDGCLIRTARLPAHLGPDAAEFELLWNEHPEGFDIIMIHGKPVPLPRWQQAYGEDYLFSGRVSRARPMTDLECVVPKVAAIRAWCLGEIYSTLNGLLVNWYDGELEHYIGKHRDSVANLIKDAPIVTISFGGERVFRMRPWKGKGYVDFPAPAGSVFVIPYDTNLAWTHEVPTSKKFRERRISLTYRAFE